METSGMTVVGKVTKATGKVWTFVTDGKAMWATADDGVPEMQFKMTGHAMAFWKATVAQNVAEGRWTAEMAVAS